MTRALATLLLGLLLAGCGFHLAGSRPLPWQLKNVHIDVVSPYRVVEPTLETSLRENLLRRGAVVAENPIAGATVLRLSDLRETRSVLSVGLDGKALEFQLITRVHYELLRDGQALLPPDTMQVTRDYSYNAQEVLAKEAEEARLRQFMQNDLAEQLMLRIDTLLAALPPAPATPAAVVPVEAPANPAPVPSSAS